MIVYNRLFNIDPYWGGGGMPIYFINFLKTPGIKNTSLKYPVGR